VIDLNQEEDERDDQRAATQQARRAARQQLRGRACRSGARQLPQGQRGILACHEHTATITGPPPTHVNRSPAVRDQYLDGTFYFNVIITVRSGSDTTNARLKPQDRELMLNDRVQPRRQAPSVHRRHRRTENAVNAGCKALSSRRSVWVPALLGLGLPEPTGLRT
jgi:hypothetical protein